MKLLLLTLFVSVTLLYHNPTLAQSRFYRNNQLEIDKAKAVLSKGCRAYESVKQTAASQLKADKKLIAFLNGFYNNAQSVSAITKELDPFFGRKWKFDTVNLGGCTKYSIPVRSDGNMRATIAFTVFQNEVVFKRINVETAIKTKCVSPAQDVIDFVDINYIDLFCLQAIDFPFSFCAGCGHLECDVINYATINVENASGYKLIPADSTVINQKVWFSNDAYQAQQADIDFVTIANNHNTYLLFRLLYSPNQVAAIYSMEAIIWLQQTGVLKKLPDYVVQKMEAIKNSPIAIAMQSGDVVKQGIVYKDLNITTDNIVQKYGTRPLLSSN